MQYLHSGIVDPSTYETQGLCDGIPLRAHSHPELEDLGTIRAQQDWNKLVSSIRRYKGGLGPQYSFMTVSVPECLPDRLEVISYGNEFAFLHDDVMDIVGKTQSDAENDRMLNAFNQAAGDAVPNIAHYADSKHRIQAKLMLEMMAIDRERAKTTIKASGRQHCNDFKSLDEYMEYRVLDVGQMFWYGMVTFVMGLKIPENEEELCKKLCRPACEAAGLTNDLFSYEKEYEASKANGLDSVVNAIWVMMKEHRISEDDAKEMCRMKIKITIGQYIEIVAQTKARTDISVDLKKYVECLQYSLSGNVVWSLSCPRYHKWATYNERQLDWMTRGVAGLAAAVRSEVPSTRATTPASEQIHDGESNIGSESTLSSSSVVSAGDAARATWLTDDYRPAKNAVFGSPGEDTGLFLAKQSHRLDDKIVNGPSEYLSSLPSKGIRSQAIDALNVWLQVANTDVEIIKQILHILHSASLMLDGFQDSSPLRRGRPSTHTVFGTAQTVNAAGFHIVRALAKVQELNRPEATFIVIEELQALYRGQSFDLFWTNSMICPSIAEYVAMIDDKTGGLFRLLTRLLQTCSTSNKAIDLLTIGHLLGRYFQIRDDYMNLSSADYAKQKGVYEDLDEGKYSLPLIHALATQLDDTVLRNLLVQRRVNGNMSIEHKMLVLERLQKAGSLAYTSKVLSDLYAVIRHEVAAIEAQSEQQNLQMRLLVEMLKVEDEMK